MLRASWFALNRPVILAAIALVLVTGCASSPSPAASSQASAAVTVTPAPTVAATEAPSSSVSAAAVTITVSSTGERNKMLVGEGARTLYTNAKDPAGSTSCTGTCATTWPPLTVKSGETVAAGPGVTGTISTFVRPDGPTQVTYNGKALYYYSGDTACKTADSACGDVYGQAVANIWYAATP